MSGGSRFDFADVFAVPNYTSFIRGPNENRQVPWLNNVERAFKLGKNGEQLTQLQWVFEKTDDPFFPLGVKTSYRAYSSPKVIEVWEKDKLAWAGTPPQTLVPYIPVSVSAPFHPTSEENGGNGAPDGMFILKAVPPNPLTPTPFVEGQRDFLEKAVNYAQLMQKNSADVQEWLDFAKQAPHTDSVEDYMARPDKK
jgi:hypothetical protein